MLAFSFSGMDSLHYVYIHCHKNADKRINQNSICLHKFSIEDPACDEVEYREKLFGTKSTISHNFGIRDSQRYSCAWISAH